MRGFMKIFGQHYSAVNTSDNCTENGNPQADEKRTHEKFRKSLQTKRTLSRGFSFVDDFFFKQKTEKGPRWPKGSFIYLFFSFLFSLCFSTKLHFISSMFCHFQYDFMPEIYFVT